MKGFPYVCGVPVMFQTLDPLYFRPGCFCSWHLSPCPKWYTSRNSHYVDPKRRDGPHRARFHTAAWKQVHKVAASTGLVHKNTEPNLEGPSIRHHASRLLIISAAGADMKNLMHRIAGALPLAPGTCCVQAWNDRPYYPLNTSDWHRLWAFHHY